MLPEDTLLEGLPPMRDRLPTLPHDLSEYARETCGPESWSAAEAADATFDEGEMISGPLLEVRRSDVPRVAATTQECVDQGLDHRAGFILSLLDGCSNVETVLDAAGLPEHQTLEVLCDLCARGIVTLAA
jgi:hypothetical protein